MFLYKILLTKYCSGQVRSQNLEKGGAFLKNWEKCKRPWPEFSMFLNQFHTVCRKAWKFKRFFRPKSGGLQKKKKKRKKGLHRNWDWFFGRNRKFNRLGGAIFNFSQKISLKSTKNVRFCILHKPIGGLKPPPRPPPLVTLLAVG